MQLDPITRAVLDAMQEGVLIIDAQERIVYGNRAYVAFLEKEAGGWPGPLWGVLGAVAASALWCLWLLVL